jgi:hypothetical protein
MTGRGGNDMVTLLFAIIDKEPLIKEKICSQL